MKSTPPIEHIRGNGAVHSPLPFSPAVRAGGFVFVSGMASADEKPFGKAAAPAQSATGTASGSPE